MDWQQLHIEGNAKESGYITVRLKNSSKSPVWFDDISLQTVQQQEAGSADKGLFVPKVTTSLNGFEPQQLITTESLYRNCTMEDDPTVNGGTLVVDATVVGTYNYGGYDYGNWGWGSGSSGSTGGTGSDGGSSSGGGSTTFTPYNAPQSPNIGDAYTSQSKVTYIWDGQSWCIVVKPVEVKGTRPTNPTEGQYHFYLDPDFGYPTVYEYISGRWTIPMADEDAAFNKYIKNAKQSKKEDGCKTFREMWNKQNEVHKEQAALITDKGVFWLSDVDNNVNTSFIGNNSTYGYDNGRYWFIKDNITYYITAILHTHPIGDQWVDYPSVADLKLSKDFKVPNYVISDGGIYKTNASGVGYNIVDYNYLNIFNCAIDQNLVDELK